MKKIMGIILLSTALAFTAVSCSSPSGGGSSSSGTGNKTEQNGDKDKGDEDSGNGGTQGGTSGESTGGNGGHEGGAGNGGTSGDTTGGTGDSAGNNPSSGDTSENIELIYSENYLEYMDGVYALMDSNGVFVSIFGEPFLTMITEEMGNVDLENKIITLTPKGDETIASKIPEDVQEWKAFLLEGKFVFYGDNDSVNKAKSSFNESSDYIKWDDEKNIITLTKKGFKKILDDLEEVEEEE